MKCCDKQLTKFLHKLERWSREATGGLKAEMIDGELKSFTMIDERKLRSWIEKQRALIK